MGDSGDGGVGTPPRNGALFESVTGAGQPALLAATSPELGRGDVLAGRYQIEMPLGTGGSGRVLRAFDRVTRSAVALKILRPEFIADPVWTERFSRELRVGRQVQHPNVCRVFDIGECDGNRFLSMELAIGGTIRAQLDPNAPARALDDRIADARAVIDGVAALHAAGIVHRDLKPENILRMADGRLVITDFGLATDPGAGPATTVMIGTPRYMASEVVMGDPATARSDVWALGVVLHEILFRRRPDRSLARRGYRHYVPPGVASIKERRLADLCGRCSDDDPQVRPSSAVEVARAFQMALMGRRFTTAAIGKQVAWAAVAVVALGTLGLVRSRWTSSAVASSPQIAGSIADRVLQPTGTPADWSKGSTRLAAFPGRVHCLSLNHDRSTVRVVWGEPRHADDINLAGGSRVSAPLLRETFEVDCPQVAPNGRSLLFAKQIDGAQQIFLAASPDGRDAKQLVRGSGPLWLANGLEFSFTLDARHAAIFSIPTREMKVVTDTVGDQFAIDDQAVDSSGGRLAVLYTTKSLGSFLAVHALPGLELVGRARVPRWARSPRFGSNGDVSFTVIDTGGVRQVVSTDPSVTTLRSTGKVPGVDVHDFLESDHDRLLITRQRRFDLWRRSGDGKLSPLTTDGRSPNGSLSASGQLIIQRTLDDGREVIVLRDEKGLESQRTQGPTDLTPSFLPGGTGWLYARDTGEIIECSLSAGDCVRVHADSLLPAYPTADPSGQRIAYITQLQSSRVRVISRTGGGTQRDLGPALLCEPVWTSSRWLWVVISAPQGTRIWAEIDADSGERSGRVRSVRAVEEQDQCPFPNGLHVEHGQVDPVVARVIETSHLVRAGLIAKN
jgi:Protein kinase domain